MRTISLSRRAARSTALLSAVVLVASGIAATMGGANAAVTRGPGETNGVPNFYKDAQGFALELCLEGTADVQCEPPDGVEHLGIYFAADATAGPLSAIYGIEAVNNTDVTPAEPMVLNGARFRFEGARPNTTYTIKDPWRTTRCRTDGTGSADCRHESSGAFSAVRNGHITTFLRSIGPSAGQFIGTHTRVNRVTGSPTGFNKVVVTGGGQTFRTARFSVMGQKRADTAMSALNRRALELGNGRQADAVRKAVRYSSIGTANARPTVRKGGKNPGAFRVTDNCASQAPGTACNISVTFRPRANVNSVKRAFLVIDDNGLAAPRRVSLKGIGLRR